MGQKRIEYSPELRERAVRMVQEPGRPIRRDKPQKPTESGCKASTADTPEGFVVSHHVYVGNPAGRQTLEAAIAGAQVIGTQVKTVLADRGYGDEAVARRGIKDSVIPRRGQDLGRTRGHRGVLGAVFAASLSS